MVYNGTPSKACERCRKRRNRCDLGRPRCQKCIKAGVECPGYRNTQDVTFKNITNKIIQRYDASSSSIRTAENTPSQSHPSTVVKRALHDQEGVLAVSMTFLFECYLRGSSFEWVRDLYEKVDTHSLFARVVEATALAAYSHECHRTRLLARSRMAYEVSLVQLRKAMATASEPITNETLASILLMSRFETLLADGTEAMAMDNWIGHIAGAFSVLESRTDEENFSGPLSLQLAEQTLNNYNMFCMKRRKIRPDSHIRAAEALYQRLDGQSNAGLRRLRLRSHRLTESFVKRCIVFDHADTSDFGALISGAASIDAEVEAFRELLAIESGYTIRPIRELQDQYNLDVEPHSSQYHSYQSSHAARLWNSIRMVILMVSWHLYEMAERINKRESTQNDRPFKEEIEGILAHRWQIISSVCDEICDSAPQFLRPGTSECTHAAASYLSWPLYVAARFLQGDSNRFAKETLKWIGVEFNMKSAIEAVEHLHTPLQPDDWLLACYMF